MQFLVTNHFIGSVRKETLQAAEERVIISRFHLTNKLLNFKRRLYFINICIKRKNENEQILLPLHGWENPNDTYQNVHHTP